MLHLFEELSSIKKQIAMVIIAILLVIVRITVHGLYIWTILIPFALILPRKK